MLRSNTTSSLTINSATTSYAIQNIKIDINEKTSVFEIAAANSLKSAGNRCKSIQLKGDITMKTLQSTRSYLEPLCYPIFFLMEKKVGGVNYKSLYISVTI
jgi:hypothetical protein